MLRSDRFPSAPIISEGYPKNITVVENGTAVFECPILSDLGVHIEWAKFYSANRSKDLLPDNVSKLEVSMKYFDSGEGEKKPNVCSSGWRF